MAELNARQNELCDKKDGFIVVDAGPGTGKTHTVVQRYVNILNTNVNPMDVLMLTFTRNAAGEMETRISSKISKMISKNGDQSGALSNALNNLRVSTIDSFCLDVVLNSPEAVKEFFDPDDDTLMLSRGAALIENETLNRQYFAEFYSRFIRDRGQDYVIGGVDYAAMIGGNHMDIYSILCKLMSRGIIPKKKGWFGNAKDLLVGDRKQVLEKMKENIARVSKKVSGDISEGNYPSMPELPDGWKTVPDELIEKAAYQDREPLIRLIHDIYYAYIIQCIRDNRLTFGLCELFAFIILFKDKRSRELHSVEYLIIDEFQDTNELQMKICLMLLKKPNMCVVGDWKQGIFGFRYVSIENITQFGDRIASFMTELTDHGIDFPFDPMTPIPIEFDSNYRSSKLILDQGFQALDIKGNRDETINNGKIVELESIKDSVYDAHTGFRCIKSESKKDEIRMAVDQITEYVFSGDYRIVEENDDEVSVRDVGFGDIAVLCRSTDNCTRVYQECLKRGIPAYLQGDLEIMLTREGKLVLAWLRFLNNRRDDRGISAILADRGYALSEIQRMKESKWVDIPDDIEKAYNKLRQKMRRLNDLITSIFAVCGLNNGVVQTIINVLSSAHENSLMTVSDLIRLIEDDIKSETSYNVEPLLDNKAVTIQTAHKSKGLEYPAVIVVGLDQGSFPNIRSDDRSLIFDDTIGLRCTKAYVCNESDGERHEMVIRSWETSMVKAAFPKSYDEERRLLFVAMTRAKQYLTVTAYNPSAFFKHYAEEHGTVVPKAYDAKIELTRTKAKMPEICDYSKRRASMSVHDLMSVVKENEGIVKREGRGKEYGEMVHEKAYLYLKRGVLDESVPEMEYIAGIINSRRDAKLSAEIKCVLPVDDISIKGTIDLIAEYDDRIEIHDYKTDMDHCFENQYRLQLSIYALAAQSIGKKVDCYIDYVALKETVKAEPESLDYVRKCIAEYREQMQD